MRDWFDLCDHNNGPKNRWIPAINISHITPCNETRARLGSSSCYIHSRIHTTKSATDITEQLNYILYKYASHFTFVSCTAKKALYTIHNMCVFRTAYVIYSLYMCVCVHVYGVRQCWRAMHIPIHCTLQIKKNKWQINARLSSVLSHI